MKYLVDTCVLLWGAGGAAERLSATVRRRWEEEPNQWCASAISAFEIGIKARRGAVALGLPPDRWFEAALLRLGLVELPVTGVIAGRSTVLPARHRDPADRMLIATAIEHGLTVVTPDHLIRQYPEAPSLW